MAAARPPAAPTRSRRLPITTPSASSSKSINTTSNSKSTSSTTTRSTSPSLDRLTLNFDTSLRIDDSRQPRTKENIRRNVITSRSLTTVDSSSSSSSSTSTSRVKVASKSTNATKPQLSQQHIAVSANERARTAMKVINTALTSLSSIIKNIAGASSSERSNSVNELTSAASSSSSSSTLNRTRPSSSSSSSSSESDKIVRIAKETSSALGELRKLIRTNQIENRAIDIERAAISFVFNLIQLNQFRIALVELGSIKASILSLYPTSTSSQPSTTSTSNHVSAHLLSIPLPSSSSKPESFNTEEWIPLILSIQSHSLTCLFKQPLSNEKIESIAQGLSLSGGVLDWRREWKCDNGEEGSRKLDNCMIGMFGTIIKGLNSVDDQFDLNDLFYIRSRAILFYSTITSLDPKKTCALFDQTRKIILLYGRRAEALKTPIEPISINSKIQFFFKEFFENLKSFNPEVKIEGIEWIGLCQVLLHVSKRANDGLAIERIGLLLESTSVEEEQDLGTKCLKIVGKLEGLITGFQVSKPKNEAGKGIEMLERIQIHANALILMSLKIGNEGPIRDKVDKVFEKLESLVVERIKGTKRLDSLVLGQGEKSRTRTEEEEELFKLAQNYCDYVEKVFEDRNRKIETEDKSRIVSGAIETLIMLAYSTLVIDDRSTYTRSFDHLERCLFLLGVSKSSPIQNIEMTEAYWVRSLASAYYNLSGMLFNAGKPESTIPFVQRACEITRFVLASQDPLISRMETLNLDTDSKSTMERNDLISDCQKYATKRFELLALSCHSIGSKKEAWEAYVEALGALPEEARKRLDSSTTSLTNLMENEVMSVKLVQRITKIATFDLLLRGDQVSLVPPLRKKGWEITSIATVLEIQIQTLESLMEKSEARGVVSVLVEELLSLYEVDQYPLRRARTMLRRMQLLCAGGSAQRDLSAAAIASEIDDLCNSASLGQDHALVTYKSQYLAFSHLWLAFHAHQARLPSSSCFDEARAALSSFRELLDADPNELKSSTNRTTKNQTPSPKAPVTKARMTTATRKRVLTSSAAVMATRTPAASSRTPRAPRGRAVVNDKITPPREPLVDLSNAQTKMVTPKMKREIGGASKQIVLEDMDNSCALIGTMASLLGALGHPILRIGFLKILRRLSSKRSNDTFVSSSIRLAHELAKLGNMTKAASLYGQIEARIQHISDPSISIESQIEYHLRHAEFLAIVGSHDQAMSEYTLALKLARKIDDDEPTASTTMRIVQRTLLLQRVAFAGSVFSTMLQRCGDLGRCLAPALQAMRLSNRALANITRLSTTESNVGSADKDETTFTSDKTDPNAARPDMPIQTKHTSSASAGSHAGMLYDTVDSLGQSILRVATLYWIRGTPKSADFFATHTLNIAEQYGSTRLMMRALSLRSEVRMQLGDLIGAEEDLNMMNTETSSEGQFASSIELVEYHRLQAALHMRKRLITEAKQDHEQAKSALELFVVRAGENEAGGSPIKFGTPRVISFKELSPVNLRLSGSKLHAGPVTSPPQPRSALAHTGDRILAAAHSRLLRMHIGLLRLEKKQDECRDLLRRLAQLPLLDEDKGEELRLLVMIRLQDLLVKLSSDAVLGMLPESVLSMPSLASSAAAIVSKSHSSPVKGGASSHYHSLKEIESLLQRSVSLSVSRARPAVLRELSLLGVTLRMLQSCIGHASTKSAATTAHALDLGLAVTLRRDMLEAIDYKLARSTRVDDLRWPSVERSSSSDPPSATSKLLTIRERYRSETAEPVLTETSVCAVLPPKWITITLHLSPERDALVLVRYQSQGEPLVFKLPMDRFARREDEEESLTYAAAFAELSDIIAASNLGTQNAKHVEGKEARIAWWAERKELDERLKVLLHSIEDSWLGAFKSLFFDSSDLSTGALATFKSRIERILKRSLVRAAHNDKKAAVKFQLDNSILECFATLSSKCRDEDLEDLYYFIMESFQMSGVPVACDETDVDQIVVDLRSALEELRNAEPLLDGDRPEHHLVLILDKSIQAFPWESLPALQGRSVSRLPSLAFLRDRLEHARSCSADASHELVIDPSRTAFIVNPGGDLKKTQERFEPWLESNKNSHGWNGIIARAPSEEEFKSALASKELVLYFGHGGAEQYIRSQTIRHLPRCAVTMLWGCSSGLLRDQGEFDPYGTPYHYMIAGCPSLVANLWDVTDKDIDTLTENVLCLTGLKYDETETTSTRLSLAQAIAQSRKVCNLRYLNGAAVVNYGLPVWFSSFSE